MTVKFLQGVKVTRLLVASYCGVLIFVAWIGFIEYKQTREAAGKINAISKKANKKLEQLINISVDYATEQKMISGYIDMICKTRTQGQTYTEKVAVPVNNNSFSKYSRIINTQAERKSFDQLLLFDSVTKQVNDSLLVMAAETNPSAQALGHLLKKKIDVYANFNATIHQLLDLVNKESKLEIAGASKDIMMLVRQKELIFYLIILVLLALGLSIANMLRKLKRTENKYRLLFDLSPLPKYIIDQATYRIRYVNTAALKLYGYTREEFLKITPFHLRRINGTEKETLLSELKQFSEAGKSFTGKARHYKKNGKPIEVEINSHTISINKRKVILVTVNDITEKERLDKKITRAIIKTQEDERRKLGAELHDNVGQILASTQLYLGMAMKVGSGKEEKYLAETRKYLAVAINEIRDISHRLFPGFLEEISFPEAISNLLEDMNPGKHINIVFEYDRHLLTEEINADIKLNIYRILQEQLNNIHKYSKATAITVELRIKENLVQLRISDNGIGFDANKIKPGIGLMNIKKRTELFSGKFLLETTPQNGCSITVEIPAVNGKAA